MVLHRKAITSKVMNVCVCVFVYMSFYWPFIPDLYVLYTEKTKSHSCNITGTIRIPISAHMNGKESHFKSIHLRNRFLELTGTSFKTTLC